MSLKSLLRFLAVILVSAPLTSFAQSDKKALEVLDAMSKVYQNYGSYSVTFNYSTGNGRPARGEAHVKDQKFRLKMADQEIMSDGKVMATFLKESNEVTLQDYAPEEIGDLNPTRIYLAYKKGYKNTYIGETRANGKTYDNVRLVPTASNAPISKVELKIDRETKLIAGWKIFGRGKDITSFDVIDSKANPALPDQSFVFNSKNFPGAEVVDLR